MKSPPPIRILFPAVLIAVGIAVTGASYQFYVRSELESTRLAALDRLNAQGTILAGSAEHLLAKGDIDGLNISVGLMAPTPDLELAMIVDASDRVLVSTQNRWRGEPLRATSLSPAASLIELARNTSSARASQINGDLVGAYPFRLPAVTGGLSLSGTGVAVVQFDIARLNAIAMSDTFREIVPLGGLLLLGGVGLWFVFHHFVTARVDRLLSTTRQIAQGNLTAKTNLDYNDDFGELAQALDAMGDAVRERERALRENEELRRTQKELAATAERLTLALEAGRLGTWDLDLRTGQLIWDAASYRLFGLEPYSRPLTGETFFGSVHPADRETINNATAQLLNSREPLDHEFRIVWPGGEVRWLSSRGRTEFDADGPARVHGVSFDITDSKRNEVAIRKSEERLAGILSIAADAIISIDNRHRITMFNHGAETVFGHTSGEVLGQPLDVLLPERFRAAHNRHVEEFSRSASAARRMGERREIYGRHKDGREFPAEASISKLEIDGEQTFTVVLRDITARKQFEDQLALANTQLEARIAERTSALEAEAARRAEAQAALSRMQRMEAFGQLAGGIAHDFNNLLTVISGNQELLEMRLRDERDLTLLKRAQEAAGMGARLTGRLLTFARQRRLEPVLLDLDEQILGMLELLRRSIGENVRLNTNLAARMWPVRTDPSEIENAILNLVINARDAMPAGGTIVIETDCISIGEGEVGLDTKLPAGDYVRISVSDTGTGMSHEVLQRAFEPFFTTKHPSKGTGLGLSTIQGFVEQSGGTVTIYSEAGKGTTINMYLPRADAAGKPHGLQRATERPAPSKGETVLLVEDRPDVRQITRERLEQLGYSVLERESGLAAIELLQSSVDGIGLVLSDVVMPGGLSGYDVARWVRTHKPRTKVLLTSGFSDQTASLHEKEPPPARMLRKPFSLLELACALRAELDG